MPRRSSLPPAPQETQPSERLCDAVETLAQNVSVLSDIVGDIREDLSWLLRNGLPHQELAVRVEQHRSHFTGIVPRPKRRSVSTGKQADSLKRPNSREETFEQLVEQLVMRLAEPLGEIAQEQLNILLGVMEGARRDVENAIRAAPERMAPTCATTDPVSTPVLPAGDSISEPTARQPGSLF